MPVRPMAPHALPGSAVLAPARALPYPEAIVLAVVGQQLLDRDCAVELINVGCGGDVDVRLLVGGVGRPVSVEVLGPYDGASRPDCWYAARVGPDGIPCVWAGPSRSCPMETIAEFVEDLLREDLRLLADRYSTVG